jgi:hypothetical protein
VRFKDTLLLCTKSFSAPETYILFIVQAANSIIGNLTGEWSIIVPQKMPDGTVLAATD